LAPAAFSGNKPDQKIQTELSKLLTSDKQKKKSKKNPAIKETLEVKKPADPEYKWSLIYPLLWEKVPLFVLAILFDSRNIRGQHKVQELSHQ